MAGIPDFYRGDTQIYELTITDENGNPVDITGATVWFTLKTDKSLPDNEAVIQKVVTDHVDPANGKTKVVLTADETANLVPNTYYFYDFQIKFQNGDVFTLIADKVKILEDVTKSS
ncbi:MAG: hypothetical protein DRH57_00260 [Candidatus Cloacimonadota bacterium]|nr:MAG: hypothetical protein DRH57_00260 [Candidatus Cloacimonadota bacterium]